MPFVFTESHVSSSFAEWHYMEPHITFQMRRGEGSRARIFHQAINLILIGNLKYSKQEKSDRKRSKTNMTKLKSALVTSEDT